MAGTGWRTTFATRAHLHQQAGGSKNAARSTVYAWHESLNVQALLYKRGIIGADGRDTRTRRKVFDYLPRDVPASTSRLGGRMDHRRCRCHGADLRNPAR